MNRNHNSKNQYAEMFVWGSWAMMLAVALFTIERFGRNMPVAEDWLMVAPMTGNEPHLAEWLWSQNGEHRVPFPKLILLLLIKLSHGDIRVGMYFSTICVGLVAAMMILGIRQLRLGQTKFVDAFFPFTLLHLGHWQNFVWSWQLTLAFPTALILLLILRVVIHPKLEDKTSAIFSGVILISLPLSGAPGLLATIFFVPWITYVAIRNRVESIKKSLPVWPSFFLLASVIVTLVLTVWYFVDYDRVRYPSSPSDIHTLMTAAKFIVMSTGLAAVVVWKLSFVVISLILGGAVYAAFTISRSDLENRGRAIVLLLLLATWLAICCLTAMARAGFVFLFPELSHMSRYVLLFSPVIMIPFFIWEICGRPIAQRVVQTFLLVGMMVLTIPNYHLGAPWGYWYVKAFNEVRSDIEAGTPVLLLAQRHGDALFRWWKPKELADHMKMLRDAKMTVFSEMPESAFSDR